MKRLMKKFWLLIVCLALMLTPTSGTAAKPAPAPNQYDSVTVYFDDGYAWKGCRVHWLGSKTLCSWPGELMTWEETQVWSASVPADAQNLIFSYDGDYSPVLTMPRDEKVLYVLSENRWKTYNPVTADGGFYVVGNTPAFSTGWDELTSANQLRKSGNEWVITYENVPIGYWEFAITNGTERWGDEYEEDRTCRFLAEGPGDMKICFNSETGEVGWTYTYDPPMDVPKMTIYCRAPESWNECYAFWSGSANTCTLYPGEAMEYVGDSLWKLDVYSDIQEVRFSNGDGSGAYAQIPFTDRMLYDYNTDHWENPVEIGELSTVRVVGNADFMGNWDVTAEDGRMTRLDEYRYEVCFKDVDPGHYEFRIAADANWNRHWMNNDRNYTVDVSETCDLVITFAPAEWGDDVVTIRQGEAREYRVVGNAKFMGNWNPADDAGLMEINDDGLYEKQFTNVVPDCYEFRIVRGETWDYVWSDDGRNYTLDLPSLSDVVITFDPMSGEVTTVIEPLVGKTIYRVVGNADFLGNWDPAFDEGKMQEVAPGVYKKTFHDVAPGDYEIRITKNGWWVDTVEIYEFQLVVQADVIVTFDSDSNTLSVKGLGPAYCGEAGPDMTTIMDVAMLYAQVCGGNVLKNSLTHYDLNGDGRINIADVAQLYNRVKMGESYFA